MSKKLSDNIEKPEVIESELPAEEKEKVPEIPKKSTEEIAKEKEKVMFMKLIRKMERQERNEQKKAKNKKFEQYTKRRTFTGMTTIPFSNIEKRKKTMATNKRRTALIETDTAMISRKSMDDVKKVFQESANSKVKINLTTVLREENLYRKKQQKEREILERYEIELRDCREYYEWREKMEVKDHIAKLKRVRELKQEMVRCDLSARLSKARKEEENQKMVKEYKKNLSKFLEKEEQLKLQELKKKQERVVDLKNELKRKREKAKLQVFKVKVKKRKQIEMERKINEIKIARKIELEKLRNRDIMQNIRAIEHIPLKVKEKKKFDPTESPKTDLLSEMSYSEMKKRIVFEKEKVKRESQERRERIKREKAKKRASILEKVKKISKYRKMTKKERIKSRILKEEALRKKVLKECEKNDEKILELHAKLAEKKQKKLIEKQKRLEQEKLRKTKQKAMKLDRMGYEKKALEDMQKCRARIISENLRKEKQVYLSKKKIEEGHARKRAINEKRKRVKSKQRQKRIQKEITKRKRESDLDASITAKKLKENVETMRSKRQKTKLMNSKLLTSSHKRHVSLTSK